MVSKGKGAFSGAVAEIGCNALQPLARERNARNDNAANGVASATGWREL